MPKPDTITVQVTKRTDVEAGSADLTVVIEGSAVFSGQEAFSKAAEVRDLLEALRRAGLDPESVKLRSVSLKSGSWSAIRSSGARYVLAVKDVAVDRLSSVLAVIAGQKGAEMTHLEWRYPTEDETKVRLRQEAIEAALAQARLDAQALGVEVLGVFNLTADEPFHGPWQAAMGGADMDMMVGRARAAAPPDLGFELGASKTLEVQIRAEFRVGSMAS